MYYSFKQKASFCFVRNSFDFFSVFFDLVEISENKSAVYEFGKFILNPSERVLLVDGAPIHLQPKEFDALVLLIEHNGRALTKEQMMSAIWHDSVVEESNLAKLISRLRKLFSTNGEQFIETLPKHGYRFAAELRRTLVESPDAVILEKRTVRRVTFAVENETDATPLALPPARQSFLTLRNLALTFVVVFGLSYLAWHFRTTIFRSTSAAIDPYSPIRLTDNPNDDTGPMWTADGRIRFTRIFPDNQRQSLVMNADGTGQSEIKLSDGRRILSWSPDDEKVLYQKHGDTTKTYIARSDGSDEILAPFRSGHWSADSKMIVYHQRVEQYNSEIFLYSVETRQSRNITNSEFFETDASFSPDGSQVVFSSTRDGNQEIYLVNLDGSNLRRLTFNPAIDTHPAFSPDGTQILFTSNRENENADVYLMDADGSNIVKVTNWDKTNETAGPGSWSFDGTKIAFFSDRNGKDDVYVVSAETIRPKVLLSNPERNLGSTSCSPDGKRLVYSEELENKAGALKVLDLETRQSTLLRKIELPRTTVDWSPDGNWIAFFDRVNGNSEIFVIRPDGTELRNLSNHPGLDVGPSWSPDGKRIVFISGRGERPDMNQLYIMNADGTDPHPVTPGKGWEVDCSWSSDGSEIVFCCDRGDSPGNSLDVCKIKPDGTEERHVIFHRAPDLQPAMSPDGKLIAFSAKSDGNAEIYVMNRDGSGLKRLTRHLADDEWPQWSPDGKKLIFTSNRTGKFAIYRIEPS